MGLSDQGVLTKQRSSSHSEGRRWCNCIQWGTAETDGVHLVCTSPEILPILLSAGSTRNSKPRPLLWVVLLLVAAALVLGVSVFVGLSQPQAQRLQEGNRG